MQRPLRITPTEPPATPAAAPHGPLVPTWLPLAGLVALLIFVLVSIALVLPQGGSDQPAGADDAAASAATPTASAIPASPTPSCRPAADWLAQITFLEAKGRWQQAADTAELAATDPHVCGDSVRELLQKAVTDGLEALYDQPFDPRDLIAQQAQLDRYQVLAERAARQELTFPTALQVSQRARASGHFRLAIEAFEQALRSGQVAPGERDLLRSYQSSLHDLGRWWASATDADLRLQGARLLVTCHQIDLRERLGSGACYGALQELIGSDPGDWPAPLVNPLLAER